MYDLGASQMATYSAQAIKECIDYELESAENPHTLMNFCKPLSLTYYKLNPSFQVPNLSFSRVAISKPIPIFAY